MNLQNVNVIIYTDGQPAVPRERFLDIFHRWIREDVLDELLVDVADYRHVPAGPDVILAGHEANYSMERYGERYGLRYNRKAPLEGSNIDRLTQAYGAAIHACRLLESELGSAIRFSRREFALFINDRALAPNTEACVSACLPEFEGFVRNQLGESDFALQSVRPGLQRLGVSIRLAHACRFAA